MGMTLNLLTNNTVRKTVDAWRPKKCVVAGITPGFNSRLQPIPSVYPVHRGQACRQGQALLAIYIFRSKMMHEFDRCR
jgi:hypothetical protein